MKGMVRLLGAVMILSVALGCGHRDCCSVEDRVSLVGIGAHRPDAEALVRFATDLQRTRADVSNYSAAPIVYETKKSVFVVRFAHRKYSWPAGVEYYFDAEGEYQECIRWSAPY